MLNIVLTDQKKAKFCENILRSLPEWFSIEEAIQNYIQGVESKTMFVAKKEEWVVGFLSLEILDITTAEIFVMGVMPQYHGRGIGKMLVQKAEEYLAGLGIKTFMVKTLSVRRENEAYAKTRYFYEACGFRPVKELPDIWGSENPAVLMCKEI